MSPGLMPRPSLSDRDEKQSRGPPGGSVAGVDAPAFVERPEKSFPLRARFGVSPGLMPRPSLSDWDRRSNGVVPGGVSPGLMPRPSLSEARSTALPIKC